MPTYSLGSEDPEIARLELQSQFLDGPTRILLGHAGVTTGMRVLDLGCGLGHVARCVGDLVGPTGEVVGIDADPRMVTAARERTSAPNVTFAEGLVGEWRDGRPFDAVVGRLILFHLADPVAALRHHLADVRPGGLVVALDYDLGAIRCEPAEPLTTRLGELLLTAFRAVGADPTIGARLQDVLVEAGGREVTGFGIEPYLPLGSPVGPAMLAGVLRSLAPAIVAHRLATSEELDVDNLPERITAALQASGSVLVPPVVSGAWGLRP